MNDIKLISAVQKQEILYNFNHSDYDNQALRLNAWNEVAAELNSSAIICKKRWSALRGNYARAKYSRAMKRLKGHPKALWTYEIEMGFLEPFVQNRVALAYGSSICKSSNSRKRTRSSRCANEEESNPKEIQEQTATSNTLSDSSQLDTSSPHTETNGTIPQVVEAVSLSENYCNMNQPQQNNILLKFFENVVHTVRNLPPALQVRAKWEISKVVHQAELEHILQTHPESFMHNGNNITQSAVMFLNDGVNMQFVDQCTSTKYE